MFSGFHNLYSQQTPEELYERALFLEEGRGDLKSAIELYKKILEQFPESRGFAAMSQLHLALCYEKLGIQDVQKALILVINNFPDQIDAVKIAQDRLIRLSQAQEKTKPKVNQYNFQFAEPVWSGPDVNLLASPSPDSQSLAYIDPDGCVVIRELATGKSRRLTNEGFPSPSSDFPLVTRWSPDGKKIVYNSYSKENTFELRSIALEDLVPRLIHRIEEDLYIRPYDWSLDGKFILATLTKADKNNQVVLFSLLDGTMRTLKIMDNHFPNNMSFSPNGQTIVYDYPSGGANPDRDIFLLHANGERETHLVQRQTNDSFPFWVSDGKRVLFLSDFSAPLSVWCLHVFEGQVERNPYPLRLNFGVIVPLGFTRSGSFFFGFATGESQGAFSGEITRIKNYFPVIPSIDYGEPKFMSRTLLGGTGSKHGTGISIHENNIYVSGWKEDEKGQGILAKYSISPDLSLLLEWSIFWPTQWKPGINHRNIF